MSERGGVSVCGVVIQSVGAAAQVGSTSGVQVLPGRGPRDGPPDRRLGDSRTAQTTPIEVPMAQAASSRSIDSNLTRYSSAVLWLPIAPSSPRCGWAMLIATGNATNSGGYLVVGWGTSIESAEVLTLHISQTSQLTGIGG